MPTWLKVLLALVAAGTVLLVTLVLVAARVLAREGQAIERAGEDGKAIGAVSTLGGCVEEGLGRVRGCDRLAVACAFETHAFLWGCLEAAPFDAGYCEQVPAADDQAGTTRWIDRACEGQGEACRTSLTVVPAFCTHRLRG